MNKFALGNNIHKRLREQHKTQRQMAKELGISEHMMSDYVNGESAPHVYKLLKIARYLGCAMDELMEGVDDD